MRVGIIFLNYIGQLKSELEGGDGGKESGKKIIIEKVWLHSARGESTGGAAAGGGWVQWCECAANITD